MEPLPDRWQDDLHTLWEKTRRRGPAGSPLRLLVLWSARSPEDRTALVRSAQAEGGVLTPVDEWGGPGDEGDVSMRFTVEPRLAALNDVFHRLCHITVTYQADLRGLGLGRGEAAA